MVQFRSSYYHYGYYSRVQRRAQVYIIYNDDFELINIIAEGKTDTLLLSI